MDDLVGTPSRELEMSLACTPNPQATSTVDRRLLYNGFDLVNNASSNLDISHSSGKQNLLSGAIDGLRIMASQLEALGQSNSDSENVPPPPYSAAPSRRSSCAAESISNSSLGLLNVNELDNGEEIEPLSPGVFSTLDLKVGSATPAAEETFDWRGLSYRSVLSESNFGSPTLGAMKTSTTTPGDSTADLKLRMQRALARRAIERAAENSLSKNEGYSKGDSLSCTPTNQHQPADSGFPFRQSADWESLSPHLRTSNPSPRESSSTIGEPEGEPYSLVLPFSPRQSSIPDLSKESFVPAEMALNELEPAFPSRPLNITQNLELSLSGVIGGDITVNSSMDANTDKKRISAGEYFGLRSDNIGIFDANSPVPPPESERPNFGHEIRSPKQVRRMPLVEKPHRLSDISLDKVPTRDTGLFSDDARPSMNTFDFTFDTSSASYRNSADLMPPPPPPSETAGPTRKRGSSRSSNNRRSLQLAGTSGKNGQSKRLSMSLSDALGSAPVADTSYFSVDESGRRGSNQTVTSLSHIAQLLSDMSGNMSTRHLVDNLLQSCPSKPPRPISDQPTATEEPRQNVDSAAAPSGAVNPDWNLSVKQRVTEWMSKSDVNAEKQHVNDEMNVERLLASNSPAGESTPRNSIISDVSSAGLSERQHLSRSTPKKGSSNSDSQKTSGTSTCTNSTSARTRTISYSTPAVCARKENIPPEPRTDPHSRVVKALSVRSSNTTSTEGASPLKSEHPGTPSVCGSSSTGRSLSRQGDTSSLAANSPFQVDSTHTQLSWPSVPVGSSKTQSFALRNKSNGRVRLLVASSHPAYKLLGERGEDLSELAVSMHCEEARRIHVVFCPSACGPITSRLTISRIGTADCEQRKERRLIPLYGMGGQSQVIIEGAPKDQWSQLFVNLTYVDGDLSGATFCARNTGDVPAFVTAQISTEGAPFSDCGMSISPCTLTLSPGQSARFSLRWDPCVEVLEWLSTNAGDVHVLANIWLSWAELSTWQRISRLYQKYYRQEDLGPLASWGTCYNGDMEPGCQLKDNKGAESCLVQSLRRIKVAVLGEREMLRGFDLDASVVFQQLTVNDTVMMSSPVEDESSRINDTTILRHSSTVLSEISTAVSPEQKQINNKQQQQQLGEELHHYESHDGLHLNTDLDITRAPVRSDSYVVRFPPTLVNHKTCAKITFKNTSTEQHHVAVRGVTEPFMIPTSEFDINGDWYLNLRVFFKPKRPDRYQKQIEIWVDGQYKLTYELIAEGVESVD